MKLHRIGLSALSLGMIAALAGCGGGNGGPLTPQTTATPTGVPQNQRFNGQYTGYFAGVTAEGNPVEGTFDNNVAGAGQITGTIKQEGFPDFSATGTVDSNGKVSVTSVIPGGSASTLAGTATLANGSSITSGTLTTKQNNQTVVNGIFAGARLEATPNPYAGNYTGSFDGGPNIKGTFAVTADKNGAVNGTVDQPGLGSYVAVGTVDRAGNLVVRAIAPFPGQPSVILLSTLTGKATTSNGAVTIAGTFKTTANGQQNASGTFTGKSKQLD